MPEVGMPAAMLMKRVCRIFTTGRSDSSTPGSCWGFTASTTISASAATALSAETATLYFAANKSSRSRCTSVTVIWPDLQSPSRIIPATSASAMLPPPIKTVFNEDKFFIMRVLRKYPYPP